MFRVGVVGGGANAEHEVSVASAAGVGDALASLGHDVVRLTIARDGNWSDGTGAVVRLPAAIELVQSCHAVFPVLHGRRGEDGTLAALCDLAGVPVVGSPLGAGAVAMDKWVTKLVSEAVGVPTARGRLTAPAAASPTLPVVVKPVASGSSHGVTLVRSPAQWRPALEAAFALDDRVLVEDVVIGREIDIAVVGRPDGSRIVSPPLEIATPASGVFDLATKYDGSAQFVVPAPLLEAQGAALEAAAIAVYDALGCAGVARVDFFLTDEGWVLNEVNTMPGFTEHSQVPRMFAAAGLPYADLVDLLLRDTLAAAKSPAA